MQYDAQQPCVAARAESRLHDVFDSAIGGQRPSDVIAYGCRELGQIHVAATGFDRAHARE